MEELKRLIKEIKEKGEESNGIKKLYEAVQILSLNVDPRNKFGGEFERMSKVISFADVLYWYLVVCGQSEIDFNQVSDMLMRKRINAGVTTVGDLRPEMTVMPPEVRNISGGAEDENK